MKIGDKALVKLDDNGYVRWLEGVVESVSEKDGIETSVISADFFTESNRALYFGDNSGLETSGRGVTTTRPEVV